MRRAGYAGAFWPSAVQESLLLAALAPDDEAARAWSRVRSQLDLDDIWDPEVHRLLPLVQNRLRAAGVDDPDMPRLQGVARRTWYENQVLARKTAPLIALLEREGIATMLLKGMPLAFHHYDSPSLRPMRDVDVLVPTARRDDAIRLMAAEGWTGDPRFVSRFYDGCGLYDADGQSLDLHWHLGLPFRLEYDEARSDDDFWDAAEPFALGGVATGMLCSADTLLHVCVHGAWSGSSATLRWIADAVTVIRRAGADLDWSRFTSQVRRRRLALLVDEPLRYLVEVFNAPVPGAVLSEIAQMPTTRRERVCRRRSIVDIEGTDLAARFRVASAEWSRASGKWGRMRATREMPSYFKHAWSLESAWHVPAAATRKAANRLARREA